MDYGIENGKLLLAEPFMIDTNFKRAVVLICDCHTDGTVGFIVNKPLDVHVHELLEGFPDSDMKLFFGGPVAHDTIHFLHNKGDLIENSVKVVDGVYWGGDFDKVKFLFENQVITPDDIKFFIGYSGWSSGQLEEELSYKSWVLANMDKNYLFSDSEMKLWSQVMNNKGGTYEVIASMSEFSNLN
ncbi:YqgE/AlgH family protein [Membranihabitans maritimus]|uniref:YqgE/AlgH family protein n=1 Tax=Membranihabitans maritimus TaxID=2904244 RepID=UPI001F17D1EA|nr:YqgE/AlgH family protein [Membranihabitans maritimus]